MEIAQQKLRQYFGYDSFRPLQAEIIKDVLDRRDVLAVMPTGSGKSLCFQIPALVHEAQTTVVVSPLIALMKDQVDGLRENGVKAAYLNSSLTVQEQQEIIERLRNKQITLLYIAPERLGQSSFLELLKTVDIQLFAIDEAHCISEWGHDFRPDYRELKKLRQLFPHIPLLALTATATTQVKNDIRKQLDLRNPSYYQASFDRKNLTYIVKQKQRPQEQILQYIAARPNESGIIYAQSRNDVDSLASFLQDHKVQALPYHAGLSGDKRQKHQEMFIREDTDIIVATIAFGMGIDKPNVRFVIHADLPKSLEGYYQETGRAGRDGLPSECILLYSYADKRKSEFFILQKEGKQQEVAQKQLDDMIHFAKYNNCRRISLLRYFGEEYKEANCKACDNCITPKETFDATILAQKILSCVYRIDERFGVKYLIDVLTGISSERITNAGHDKLSTFGIVTDYTPQQLQTIIRELIDTGYLAVVTDPYPIVKLTEKSKQVLLKKEAVHVTKPEEKAIKTKKKISLPPAHQGLFEALRQLRKRLADEQQVPPYVIFPDTTLYMMASILPQTKAELRGVSGVGDQKLQKYGEVFLQEITTYCKTHDIIPIPTTSLLGKVKRLMRGGVRANNHSPRQTSTIEETLELFRKGLSIEEIAKQRGLAPSTTAAHLEEAYIHGEDIDLEEFVTKEKQRAIRKAFEESGVEANNYSPLRTVKEVLGNDYSYDEIRFVRAMILKEQR